MHTVLDLYIFVTIVEEEFFLVYFSSVLKLRKLYAYARLTSCQMTSRQINLT